MLIGQIVGLVTEQIDGVDSESNGPAKSDSIGLPSGARIYIQETPARSHGTELR